METSNDAAGIVGIYSANISENTQIYQKLILAMSALQHRGQDSAGIALYRNQGTICLHSGTGKVREIFTHKDVASTSACAGIGRVRSISGETSCIHNTGPFILTQSTPMQTTTLAFVHDGHIFNSDILRSEIVTQGQHQQTDSELLAQYLLQSKITPFRKRIHHMMSFLQGAYSLVVLTQEKLYALRDPWGIRPLCLGQQEKHWIVASETCALSAVGATYIRDIQPGELVTIDTTGMHSEIIIQARRRYACAFEYIYFSDPTSDIQGISIYEARESLGKALAKEHPAQVDIIIPIPETSIPAALGYAKITGIPYKQIIMKNRYSTRSFLQSNQDPHHREVTSTFQIVPSQIQGKKILLVDDSIIRGTTTKYLVSALRNQGAREVHLRLSAPPIKYTCQYGINLPDSQDLIASNRSVHQIAEYLDVDSLRYLSVAGLIQALKGGNGPRNASNQKKLQCENFCFACMSSAGTPEQLPALSTRHMSKNECSESCNE